MNCKKLWIETKSPKKKIYSPDFSYFQQIRFSPKKKKEGKTNFKTVYICYIYLYLQALMGTCTLGRHFIWTLCRSLSLFAGFPKVWTNYICCCSSKPLCCVLACSLLLVELPFGLFLLQLCHLTISRLKNSSLSFNQIKLC